MVTEDARSYLAVATVTALVRRLLRLVGGTGEVFSQGKYSGTLHHRDTKQYWGRAVKYPRVSEIDVIFEVFTAVTVKNAVFWDIKTQFVLHRRHITSPLQSPAG
jgi:hypothetical protein